MSVYIFATVVLLAYLSNFALTTSTVSTFKFVSIGPLITSDNDRDLSTSDLPYLTLSELAPPLYPSVLPAPPPPPHTHTNSSFWSADTHVGCAPKVVLLVHALAQLCTVQTP